MLKNILKLNKTEKTTRFKYIGNDHNVVKTAFYEGFSLYDMAYNKDGKGAYLDISVHFKDPKTNVLVCDANYLHDHVDGVLQDFVEYILKEFGNNVIVTDVSADGKESLHSQAKEQIQTHMTQTVPSIFLNLYNYFMKGRRERLNEVFKMPTYKFVIKESLATEGQTFETGIMCLLCGFVSYNKLDVVNYYCGHCHKFHERIL